jgi:hypothetical protein
MNLFFAIIQQTLQFLGSTSDPSSPANGSIWYRNDLGKFRGRENGVSKDLIGAGGSLTQLSGLANMDFGNEESNAIVTISNAVITNANIKSFTFILQETADTSFDDFYLNGLEFLIQNIIDNTSFDLVGVATNGASGIYQIKYILNY